MAMFEHLDSEHFKAEIKRLEEENAALKETIRQLRRFSLPPSRSRYWKDEYDYLPYEEDDRS